MARSNRSAEKEAFWRSKLLDQPRSGLNVRRFCERAGISQPSFYAWRREIQKRDVQTVGDREQLIPVDVIEPDRATEAIIRETVAPLEIVTPGGFTLRFDQGTTGDRISMLLQVVGRYRNEGSESC